MTASCPCCGRKWDIEDKHYSVILRCGDEHDIYCGHCERTIPFVVEREYSQGVLHTIEIQRYLKEIERLEEEAEKR